MEGIEKFVKFPLPTDVLLGRGSGPASHQGNVLFRKLVAKRKAEYNAAQFRSQKQQIAKEIVNEVFKANGRFMKQVDPTLTFHKWGLDPGKDLWWEIVDDDVCTEKTKQALRQLPKMQKRMAEAAASRNDKETTTSNDAEPKKKKQRTTTKAAKVDDTTSGNAEKPGKG